MPPWTSKVRPVGCWRITRNRFMVAMLITLTLWIMATSFIVPMYNGVGAFHVAFVRPTGRTGNWMFEHVFWSLMAAKYGKPFLDIYATRECPTQVFSCDTMRARRVNSPTELADWGNSITNIPDYPLQFHLYRRHRTLIRTEILRPVQDCAPPMFDVIVHVRLEDVMGVGSGYELYTLLPLSYYKMVFREILRKKPIKSVAVIGHAVDREQEKILTDIASLIEHETKLQPHVSGDGNVANDMQLIMNTIILVASTSTFWVWPSFLSCTCNETYVPLFGVTKQFELLQELDDEDIVTTQQLGEPEHHHPLTSICSWSYGSDGRYCMHVYDVALSEKLRNVSEMYDVLL